MDNMDKISSKAVRDKIPEIIRASGKECVVKEVPDSSFLLALENKLNEEVKEYSENKDIEELVDLLEVIHRIAELRGFSRSELETLRLKKRNIKGGFMENLLLFNSSKKDNSLLIPELSNSNCSSDSVHSINSFIPAIPIIPINSYRPTTSINPVNRLEPAEPVKPGPVAFKSEDAEIIDKHGVKMKIYTSRTDSKNAALVYQETDKGHSEEFLHEKSDFIYYILEGSGIWVIEDKEYEVKAGDVLIVPAGNRFWFRGNLKQICITAPAWEEKYERHIRDIELS